MPIHDGFNQCSQRLEVPLVSLHRFLEDFMEDNPERLRSSQFTKCLNTILEYSSSLAAYGICHNGCRNQMIRMQDYHVVRVVDDALSSRVKVTDQMDIRVLAAWTLEPRLPQDDDLLLRGLFVFDQ